MTRKTQRTLRRIIPYIAVSLIGLLIVFGVYIITGDRGILPSGQETRENASASDNTDANGGSSESGASDSETDGDTMVVEPDIPTVPAVDGVSVNKLVDRYYTAKISGDSAELNKIVDAETSYDEAELKNETQYIVRYDNFTSYTLPGPSENYFVVYVKYDIFFNGIETGAPALNRFVVTKSENGEYYIIDKELSGEFQEFLHEQEETDTVRMLRSRVNIELQEACDKDADLAYLMSLLNGNLPESTEAATSTETEAPSEDTESPEETSSEESSSSESESASEASSES